MEQQLGPTQLDKFHAVTYPRSGINLLRTLFGQQGYNISSSHTFDGIDKDTKILTIIRNPLDTISSHFAMAKTYSDSLGYPGIDGMIERYIKDYTWLSENYSYIVDYEDLVSSPGETVEKLLKQFDLPYSSIKYRLDIQQDDPSQQYLASSKKAEGYSESREYILASNLIDEANDLYRQMLFAKWVIDL
jgi:hypothetical protein